MASYNKVFLIGNLTRDPSVKQLPSNTTVAEFGIATNRKYRTAAGEEKDEVCFVDCTAFGRQAETIAQYCTKGRPLFCEGRLKWDSWQDRDGTTRSKLTVVVESFQFVGGRPGGGEDKPLDENDQRAMAAGVYERQQAAQGEKRQWRGRSSGPVDHRGPLEADPGPMFRGGGKPKSEAVAPPFGEESHFKADDLPFAWEGRFGQAL